MVRAAERTERSSVASDAAFLAAVALVGSMLGVATAYGQAWLPDDLGSLANSSGTWCLAAFALALLAPRLGTATASGAVVLLAMLAGYVVGADVRGDASSRSLMVFWGLAALLVGPVLGVCASLVRRGRPNLAAVGSGVMSGVLVGEGIYGLLRLSETTYPPFWWGEIVAGIGVLGVVAAGRLRRLGPTAIAMGTAVVVAAAFASVYALDLIALLS